MRTLALVALLSAPASASDIKDYVRYQTERLRTYDDATTYHNRTKLPVVVWIGLPDSEEQFQAWSETKDLAYHVFLKEHPQMNSGVVLGGNLNGKFVQLGTHRTLVGASDFIKKTLKPPVLSLDNYCPPGIT